MKGQQVFSIFIFGRKHYFCTIINGNGYYFPHNNSILGSLYNEIGQRIDTRRVNFSFLKPVPYDEVISVFPNFKF